MLPAQVGNTTHIMKCLSHKEEWNYLIGARWVDLEVGSSAYRVSATFAYLCRLKRGGSST